ncbi:MAG TPA: hypothetical protein VF543_12215 [Pyrinomonadaceae bacterium]
MNTKPAWRILGLLLALLICSFQLTVKANRFSYRNAEPQMATLLSQIAHKDFTKANFNFQLGVRGDSTSPPTRNVYDVRYGGYSYNGDNDWIDVPIAHGSRSKIIDMGALNWAEVFDVPVLHVNPEPYTGGRRSDFGNGRSFRTWPEDTMVKPVVSHMYLLHTKDNDRDLYVMFRVEALKSGDEVTISWKIVPSPEKNQG